MSENPDMGHPDFVVGEEGIPQGLKPLFCCSFECLG
jgi:hypothetical protein